MYNGHDFTRKLVGETEGAKEIDMGNVYDVLYPFANDRARTWVFGVEIVGKLIDRAEGLITNYTVSKDFKFKTLEQLLRDLQAASLINNPALTQHLNDDVAAIIFADDEIQLLRYKLKKTYDPFSGKSEKEIAILLVSNFVTRRQKVLHSNFFIIFDELELEFAGQSKNFYKLNRVDQRAAIYGKVDALIAELGEENPAPVLPIGA